MSTTPSIVRRLRRVVAARINGPLPARPAPDPHHTTPTALSQHSGPSGLLVPNPVFVLSSVRSGSTLLRLILDSHSAIHAPHEMHLASLAVTATTPNTNKALRSLGLDEHTLENVLWDRVLQLRLAMSGKQVIVDKTPNTTFHWRRVMAFWPQARSLILLRHPLRVAESLISSRPDIATDEHYRRVTRYAEELAAARLGMRDVHTTTYERLTADPAGEVGAICDWIGVPYEPAMLDYSEQRHDGRFARGLGDWSENIRSGSIRPASAEPAVDELPPQLLEACALLGYPTG